jgi:adenylate kinase family enzyme
MSVAVTSDSIVILHRVTNLVRKINLFGAKCDPDNRGAVIVVNGMPGVGKGSIFKQLEAYSSLRVISTSEELRRKIADRADREEMEWLMARGEILPHDLVLDSLVESLDKIWANYKIGQGPILLGLDGYPRSLEQVNDFRGWSEALFPHCTIFHALVDNLPEEEICRRIVGAKDRGGRPDDRMDILNTRFRLWGENFSCYREFENLVTRQFSVPVVDQASRRFLGPEEVFSGFLTAAEKALQSVWF